MWYVKMYFSEKREFFQCDASGIQGVPSVDRELPFLESLLTFLEMDCRELTPALQRIADRWSRLIAEFDRDAGTEAMVELGQLKSRHIYLELLYVRWYDRFSRIGIYGDRGSAEDEQMLAELRDLPEQLLLYQKQVQRFFDLVRTDRATQELDGFVKGEHEYYPIPQDQIDLNANLEADPVPFESETASE